MPRISVIVPVYNVEKYICRCIDSVLAQTFPDFELILVDDGSADSCPRICDEYAARDKRIRVIHQDNCGVSAARNTGIETSSGEYITFIDSDDYIDSAFFLNAVRTIHEKKADVYLAGHKEVKNQGVVREIAIAEDFCSTMDELSECQVIELLAKNYIASSCGKLISRQLVGTTRFDCSMNFGEDLKFMYEIIQKPGTMYAQAESYYYYWVEYRGGTNLTALVNEKKCISVAETYHILFESAKKWGKTSRYRQFVSDRWLADYAYLEQMIFDSSASLWKQHKMWSALLNNAEMRAVLMKNADKQQQVYIRHPTILLLKRYGSKLKRMFLR